MFLSHRTVSSCRSHMHDPAQPPFAMQTCMSVACPKLWPRRSWNNSSPSMDASSPPASLSIRSQVSMGQRLLLFLTHTEHTAIFYFDLPWAGRFVTGTTCVHAGVFKFIFELRGRCCISYLACWILTARYMSEVVKHCDSLPKIHTALCRTPLNALTLAHS